MRIKRLEIQGFKSFKDKTIIYFDRPITGIVGPNGSGKSNIVDAFFWVMGEQSYKHIRSSGSDDIIFKGSSKYQPLGMAEATLVMEQDEVDTENAPMGATAADPSAEGSESASKIALRKKEISVTRRVYRSGEGEYFINGVPARLKDIQELFLDTGVGAKGYSVIEQGQIDKVVNSKPEDRRQLIEDAAGIAKYKQRKKESLRKLESANQNLLRLNDVLAEIDRSLASLERQAQKARRYKEHRAELLEKETTWGRRKYQVLNRQIKQMNSDREGLEQLLIGLRAELSQTELDLETQRNIQVTDSKAAEQIQAEIEKSVADLTHHQSALELSRRRQEDLDRQLAQLNFEQNQIEDEVANHRESILSKSEEFAGIDGVVEALTAEVEALNREVSELRVRHDQYRTEAEMKRREFVSLTESSSEHHSKIAALRERGSSASEAKANLDQRAVELATQMETQGAVLGELSSRLEGLNENRNALKTTLKDKRTELSGLEGEHRAAKVDFDKALKTHATLNARLRSLEDLEHAREGMANGPKKLLEWSQERGNSFAVLSDFIEVADGYDTAVQSVLGHAFERLYAQNADYAFEALHFLRSQNLGTASIQIASPYAGAVDRANYNPLKKYIRLATPSGYSAEAAKSVHKLIECLVASVEVLEEVPLMGDIQTYQSEGISFVTKNGIWFDAVQGVLFGGVAEGDQASSILSRKRTIQELKTEVAEAEENQTLVEQRLNSLAARLDSLNTELRSLIENETQLEIEIGGLEREKQRAEKDLKNLSVDQEKAVREQARLLDQIQATESEVTALENELIQNSSRKTELETWIATHESELAARDAELRGKEERLQELRVQEASDKERKNSLKKELESEQRYLSDRERRLTEVTRLLETFSEDRAQYSQGDGTHESEILVLTRLLSEKRESISVIRDRLEIANREVSGRMERIKELHKLGDEKTQIVNQYAIEFERIQSELNHLKLNMEEKYGLGCLEESQGVDIQEEMNDPVVTLEMSEEQERALNIEVEELREKIRRLGEVNTMAVEEYEQMQKRHEHLFKEKMDLETSMQNLNDAIDHINKTSEERFSKAFEAIAVRFEKLFPIIFGGGQAQLSLVYPEGSTDILDAGVDILAQPPGKKISNMTLLSGGEKALTAISLIFAIFMVKPSPFCILDEVDAPLDDSNIGKFNALVREMSVKSQFILVTHNKKTMELNDTLYGVTMEEPGVSRMVSIQLQ